MKRLDWHLHYSTGQLTAFMGVLDKPSAEAYAQSRFYLRDCYRRGYCFNYQTRRLGALPLRSYRLKLVGNSFIEQVSAVS